MEQITNDDKTIKLEQIIAGALATVFEDNIDTADISLLTKDIEAKLKKKVSSEFDIDRLLKYVWFEACGWCSLKLGDQKETNRKECENIAGEDICEYFNSLDMKAYLEKKREWVTFHNFVLTDEATKRNKMFIEAHKKVLHKKAKVLLISASEEEYEELLREGYEYVDRFKSAMRAEHYFSSHPRELRKYQIILFGELPVNLPYYSKLKQMLDVVYVNDNTIVASISKHQSAINEYPVYIRDTRTCLSTEPRCQPFYSYIAEQALARDVLNTERRITDNYPPIEDYVNPVKLPLPTKKDDLKIEVKELNDLITYPQVYTYGESDITILKSHTIPKDLLPRLKEESTEQCKDTGRELEMLVTYTTRELGMNFGDLNLPDACTEITLDYSFGGSLGQNLKPASKVFRVIQPKNKIELNSDSSEEIVGFIKEVAATIYDEAVRSLGRPGIEDLDYKTAEQYNDEYQEFLHSLETELDKWQQTLDDINAFDSFTESVTKYLQKPSNRLEGLRITASGNGIRVEMINGKQVLCAMTFTNNNRIGSMRVFAIETATKKGTLAPSQTVGIYTPAYDKFKNSPSVPNEKQKRTLAAIYKRADVTLKPLLENRQNGNKRRRRKRHIIEQKPKKNNQ